MILKYLRQTRFYNLNTGDITIYLAGNFFNKKNPFSLWISCILGKLLYFPFKISLKRLAIEGKSQQKFLREGMGTTDDKEPLKKKKNTVKETKNNSSH